MSKNPCGGVCREFPNELKHCRGELVYDRHAFCRNCNKYFLKSILEKNKLGGKVLCPCCHGCARQHPSSSARNRTIRRRLAKLE
jgi:hypothetical protein|tara:strand:+ start:3772 stop:4023 length:252 start_codon:yes stop_codon:yes gene_type:complete